MGFGLPTFQNKAVSAIAEPVFAGKTWESIKKAFSPATGSQQTSAEPWGPQQPYLLDLFNKAQERLNSGGAQYYPGQAVTGQSADTTNAQDLLRQQVASGTAPTVNAANQALQFNLTDARDVNSNPYLQSAIQAAIQPAIDRFQDSGGTLSQIRDEAANTGTGLGYGTRGDIATGLATARLNRDILGTSATMASQGYQSGLDASKAALATAPGIINANALPAEQLSAVGTQQDQYSQALIDEAMNKWNFEQNAPSNQLSEYQGLITGNFGGTATAPAPTKNPVGGAAGGALLGLQASGGNPYAAAGGALLGYLMSR